MPDRYGDHDPDSWPQIPPPDAAAPQTVPDEVWAAEQRKRAIVDCGLCDDDGYNAARRVCDHQDHAPVYERGMAAVREAMGWDA